MNWTYGQTNNELDTGGRSWWVRNNAHLATTATPISLPYYSTIRKALTEARKQIDQGANTLTICELGTEVQIQLDVIKRLLDEGADKE